VALANKQTVTILSIAQAAGAVLKVIAIIRVAVSIKGAATSGNHFIFGAYTGKIRH
jgi:hypothetical protein